MNPLTPSEYPQWAHCCHTRAGRDRQQPLQSSRPKECNTGAMVIDSPELDQVSSGGEDAICSGNQVLWEVAQTNGKRPAIPS